MQMVPVHYVRIQVVIPVGLGRQRGRQLLRLLASRGLRDDTTCLALQLGKPLARRRQEERRSMRPLRAALRAAQCAQFQCGGVTVDIRRHDFDSNNGICLLWQAHSADHNVSQKSLQTELYEHFLTKIDLHFVFGNIEHDAGMCTVYMCSEQCRDVVRFH